MRPAHRLIISECLRSCLPIQKGKGKKAFDDAVQSTLARAHNIDQVARLSAFRSHRQSSLCDAKRCSESAVFLRANVC